MRFDLNRWFEMARERAFAYATWQRLKYLGAAAAAILFWQIADAIPSLFFNTKAFQARLDELMDTSGVAISYQGVDVSLFRGVRIIGVRVSFDRDFSRGRYLLEAPAVYVRVPFGFPDSRQQELFSSARIIIEEGQIGYWLTSDAADAHVLNQARRLLQNGLRYHVECDNCEFSLNVKDNSYFQEITPVERLYFTLRHAGNEIESLVRYESSRIGDGDFFGKFNACLSLGCDDLQGYWYYKPVGLSAVILNNFQKDYDIASGIVSGEVAFDRRILEVEQNVRGKKTQVREPVSNFRMGMAARDFTIHQKKKEWYHSDSFAIDTRMLIRGSSSTGFVHAGLEHYDVHADFEDLRPDSLPEKYTFRVEPKLFGKKILNLPAQKKLVGLTGLSINLSGRSGSKYARAEMNLDIRDGAFSAGDEKKVPLISIPAGHMTLNNEKFSGEVTAVKGSSAVRLNMQGVVELFPVNFKPHTDALMREKGGSDEWKIFALRGKLNAPLTSENILWADLKPYVDFWLDDYWENVRDGMHFSWLPSHLKRREYFIRFIQYLDFTMPIEVKNFDWGDKTPLKGQLFFAPQYGGGGFRLESGDGKNSTNLTVSYGGDIDAHMAPYMTHDLKLNLENGYDLLRPWLGSDYFEYFSGIEIVHINSFSGERPADHYLKSMAATDIRLKRVRLGAWARAQSLPLQWETVDIRTNRNNGYGQVSSIRAENENTLLSGYGEYKLFDRQVETILKYNVLIK